MTSELYNRSFLFFSTLFGAGVLQTNCRAFYKMLHGYIDEDMNIRLMLVGLAVCFCLPMLGVYDMYLSKEAHAVFSFVGFIGIAVY